MPPTYLTQEGLEKINQELEHLVTVRRLEVAERLCEALEDGDAGVDADAECDAARNEQAFVEGRIQELERILSTVQIIDGNGNGDGETAQVGAHVTIKENGSKPETYTIVGKVEARPSEGFISNESPLGQALLDQKVGDEVEVSAPNGSFTVKITKIE